MKGLKILIVSLEFYKYFDLVCKDLRRVIQIDVNDHSGTMMDTKMKSAGFSNKTKIEAIDHNKQFYRISLDINFRNIDLVRMNPQTLKTKRKVKEEKAKKRLKKAEEKIMARTSLSPKIEKHNILQMTSQPTIKEGSSLKPRKKLRQNNKLMTQNKMYIYEGN